MGCTDVPTPCGTTSKCVVCPQHDGITHSGKGHRQYGGCVDPADPAIASNISGVLSATSFAGPWHAEGSAMPDPPNGVPMFGNDGTVYMWAGSGTQINNSRCLNQNAFLVMHKAASLAAARAGQWTEVNITYQLAGTEPANNTQANPDDLCVSSLPRLCLPCNCSTSSHNSGRSSQRPF